MTDELVKIGYVAKAHGLGGEVVVRPLSDVEGRFEPGAVVDLDGVATVIATSRPHQGRVLVRFEGVTDRTAAEALRGRSLLAPPADLTDTDAYYVHELVGMAVVTPEGDHLGDVSEHIELPDAAGYDLLEVTRDDGSTWLLPAVDEYVEVGELPDGTELLVVVDPPEGLVTGEPAVVPTDDGPTDDVTGADGSEPS